jgi:hypothetical protein
MTFCLLSAAMPAATSDLVASHPCDLVSKRNGSDDGHAAMLFIKARFIVLGRSPIAALYHLDALRISFGAVKLLP